MKERKIVKKYISIFLCMVLFLVSTNILGLVNGRAKALEVVDINSVDAHWDVGYANECVFIETYDKTKTAGATMSYGTVAFTISRCGLDQKLLNNGATSDWLSLRILDDMKVENKHVVTLDGIEYTYNKWEIPIDKIYNEALRLGYLEWAEEIKSYYIDKTMADHIVYLKFDCVLVTRTVTNGISSDSGMYFPKQKKGFGTVYTNTPEDLLKPANEQNPTRIQSLGWSATTKERLSYRYNRYLSLDGESGGAALPGGELDPDNPAAPGPTLSLYETANVSTKFNVSKAIPSGEVVTNMVSASSCTGSVTTTTGTSTKDYSVTYTYVYNGETLSTETFNLTASVSYDYITGLDIKSISCMTVNNNAFYNGSTTYNTSDLTNTSVIATLKLYSQSALNAGRTWDNVTNGTNITGYDYTPSSKHYSFADSSLIKNQTVDLSGNYGSKPSAATLATRISQDKASVANIIGNNTSSKNDSFILSDNGLIITYMSDTSVTGAKVTDNATGTTYSEGSVASESQYAYGRNGTYNNYVNSLSAKRARGKHLMTIPFNTQNDTYPTGMTATYTNIFDGTQETYYAGKNFYASGDSIYNHVIYGYVYSEHNYGDPDDGYPIRVHTAVVSPIEITFYNEDPAIELTQLVDDMYNAGSEYQLKLDNSYYLKFDTDLWASNVYGVPEGYGDWFDRYVEKKTVRFPFSVIYNGVYYPKTGTGYTVWIEVEEPYDIEKDWNDGVDVTKYESANHWQMMPFYVPSFSEEGGEPSNNVYVETCVYAYNFNGTEFADDDETAVEINTENGDVTEYTATTRKQVQLSGWIYDFTITGTSNQSIYTGTDLADMNLYTREKIFSMCANKYEMPAGPLTRFGTSNKRFLMDGTLNTSWNLNQTAPLRTGQSLVFPELGEVWKGETFGYSIKTIANLTGPYDSIKIVPHYTYVTSNGEVLSSKTGDFKMYLVDDGHISEFKPGDISALDANTVQLSDDIFKESFYDTADAYGTQQIGDWVKRSVDRENLNNSAYGWPYIVSDSEYMNRKIPSYNINGVNIPCSLRFSSGEYEELRMNDGSSYDRVNGNTNLTTYYNMISNYSDSDQENLFKDSMQQWESCFMIPTNVYLIDTRTLGGGAFDLYSYIDSTYMFSWEDCPIIDDGKGKLIIGFDIVAYRNGVPYLSYSGTSGALGTNMWLTEGSSNSSDPLLPYDYDDVAIVDMSRSTNDFIEAGILNIN